jgi:hypothetical protein
MRRTQVPAWQRLRNAVVLQWCSDVQGPLASVMRARRRRSRPWRRRANRTGAVGARQAFAALRASPGARACYDQLRARGVCHHAALRQLGNRLVGILRACLKTRSPYDEATAWAHHQQDLQTAA